jgi:hypothetical protein
MPWSWLPIALQHLTGIEAGEVLQALSAAQRWPRPAVAEDTGVKALVIWARTKAGRPLKVAVRQVEGREWLIVGAQDLTPDEVRELEAWEADRDR